MLPPALSARASLPPTLRSYVRSHLPSLLQSPCLVVTSSPPPSSSPSGGGVHHFDAVVDAHVKSSSFFLASEFNLRTVPCTVSSAFPTLRDVDAAVDLARRAGLKPGAAGGGGCGEGTVIGVGSGPAIDLAKAVADSLFGNVGAAPSEDDDANARDDDGGGRLILSPATMGGLWAARSSAPALLLDVNEEMILPHLPLAWDRSGFGNAPARRAAAAVTLEGLDALSLPPLRPPGVAGAADSDDAGAAASRGSPTVAHIAAATLAVVLDAARSLDDGSRAAGTEGSLLGAERQRHARDELAAAASHAAAALRLAGGSGGFGGGDEKRRTDDARRHAAEAIVRAGTFASLSGAAGGGAATLPQSLACALLPRHFPGCHLLTLLGSTLPDLCGSLAAASRRGAESDPWKGAVLRAVFSGEEEKDSAATMDDLAAWSSNVAARAGFPSAAELSALGGGGGAPVDPGALVGMLDSYEVLVGPPWGPDAEDRWVLEDVLRRFLQDQ